MDGGQTASVFTSVGIFFFACLLQASKGGKSGGGKGGGKRSSASHPSSVPVGGGAGGVAGGVAASALAETRAKKDEVERRRTDPLTDLHLWTFWRQNPLGDGGKLPVDEPEWPGPLKEVTYVLCVGVLSVTSFW